MQLVYSGAQRPSVWFLPPGSVQSSIMSQIGKTQSIDLSISKPPNTTSDTVSEKADGAVKYSTLQPGHSQSSPQRCQLGVAFRNIDVYGFDSSQQYQATVTSYILAIPTFFWNKLRKNGSTNVQILRDFSGLVRSGEMLLVLGRPSSGCTTLLKTLAGQTQGIHVEGSERINYQGMTIFGRSSCMLRYNCHFPNLRQ